MIIRKAEKKDLEQIRKIYEYARAYMAENGNPTQWGTTYPPEEQIQEDIDNGISYVAEEEEQLQAVFVFFEGEDEEYKQLIEGEWLNDRRCGIIHRVATLGKKGMGSFCIKWCISQNPNLKCDTHDNNLAMQHALQKNGFQRCGRIRRADGQTRITYQRNA